MEVGAVRELLCPPSVPTQLFLAQENIRHLVPWFVISKTEGTSVKHRLITDCRELNKHFQCPPFRMEHLGQIFPFLRPGMWAAKIDLKHAYFHLPVSKGLQKYLVLKVGDRYFQVLGAPFGLNVLPYLWTQTMKPLSRLWGQKGILAFVYLDDILILGKSAKRLKSQVAVVLQTLIEAGLVINFKKSFLEPSQNIQHLGFTLNLQEGLLQIPKSKLTSLQKELRQFSGRLQASPRKMASVLGVLRSFLLAFPALRCFNDMMLAFVRQHRTVGWDQPISLPQDLKLGIAKVLDVMAQWKGRSFQGQVPVRRLNIDSSDLMWAGVDLDHPNRVQEHWRESGILHITVKELSAAVQTVMSLAKPKEVIELGVDNSVAYYYLLKGGGRLPHLNKLMRQFWTWCLEKEVEVRVHLLKSEECLADRYTRLGPEMGDCTLHKGLF